jgi:preprotein translocase subunit SecA
MLIYLPEIFPIKESLEFKFDNLISIAARCAVNTRYEIRKQLLNVDEVVDQQINFLNDKILLLIPVR